MARDPDAIQREIEATRVELAAAIDAIAEKVSPRRAATRGASAVRGKLGELRGFISEPVSPTEDGQLYQTRYVLRKDRLALVGGAAVALTAFAVLRRRRRR